VHPQNSKETKQPHFFRIKKGESEIIRNGHLQAKNSDLMSKLKQT
jgi:hypothetical protein